MAITSDDINNQRFSIAKRGGYDVDEVDVFLERVADEIDAMNAIVADYEIRIEDLTFQITELNEELRNKEAALEADVSRIAAEDDEDRAAKMLNEVERRRQAEQIDSLKAKLSEKETVYASVSHEKDARIAVLENQLRKYEESAPRQDQEKDARIAELEAALAEKDIESKAISQALVVAQRSADEIVQQGEARAADIIAVAREDAVRLRKTAEADREEILDDIEKLQSKREEVRNAYKKILQEFIDDASKRLVSVIGDVSDRGAALEAALASEEEATAAQEAEAPAAVILESDVYAAPRMDDFQAVPEVEQAVADEFVESYDGGFDGTYAEEYVEEDPCEQQDQVAVPMQDELLVQPATSDAFETMVMDVVPVEAVPVSMPAEKDMSGFGDADDFGFDELD